MILTDLYILVDTEKKEIIDKFQKLPKNWKNISGLDKLSNEKLEDLKWAGHHNLGWINIFSPKIKGTLSIDYSPRDSKISFASL